MLTIPSEVPARGGLSSPGTPRSLYGRLSTHSLVLSCPMLLCSPLSFLGLLHLLASCLWPVSLCLCDFPH